jgi:NO-binding membrane sensor protein with MHYT domain
MVTFYDPILVALSIVVAIFGSLTALLISSDHERRIGVGGYAGCLACYGGIVMGGSIWSMHFIAMLALHVPVSINYEPLRTALSLALPIFITGLSLRIASRRLFGKLSLPVGGFMMGLAISAMHYLGMDAIRGCAVGHSPEGVALAVAISIGAATVALWFVFRKRNAIETVLGAVVLGLAIAGMHYTAMFATSFAPLSVQIEQAVPVMAQDTLAYAVAAAMVVICVANFAVMAFVARQQAEEAY